MLDEEQRKVSLDLNVRLEEEKESSNKVEMFIELGSKYIAVFVLNRILYNSVAWRIGEEG